MVDVIGVPFSNVVVEAVILTCTNSSPGNEYILESSGDMPGANWTSRGVTVMGDGSARTLLDPVEGPVPDQSYRLTGVPMVVGVALFQSTLENQSSGSPPSGNAEVGTWGAGASAQVFDGVTKELRVHGPPGMHQAFGRATQPAAIGTPLRFEFEVHAATHDKTNLSYTPTWLLYGPTTGGVILGIRLNDIDWVSTGLRIHGNGTPMLITDPAGGLSSQQSYRIVPQSP